MIHLLAFGTKLKESIGNPELNKTAYCPKCRRTVTLIHTIGQKKYFIQFFSWNVDDPFSYLKCTKCYKIFDEDHIYYELPGPNGGTVYFQKGVITYVIRRSV